MNKFFKWLGVSVCALLIGWVLCEVAQTALVLHAFYQGAHM